MVIFVRDPVTRFVSGFYSRFRRGMPRHNIPWTPDEAKAFADFSSPNELALALDSGCRTRRHRAVTAMQSIGHVNASYWDWFGDKSYFASRREDLFFIGFQETLSTDFEVLKAKLGLPRAATLPTDDRQSHRTPPQFDIRLEERAINNLRKWYARDYEFIRLCERIAGRKMNPIRRAPGFLDTDLTHARL